MNLKTQSGRSMVEMLGTLAIIGVLSIGGIAGYSYGMDKYRCNQTMRDISLRTVDLITQASQGRTTLSLSEWENEDTVYDISNPAYSDDGLVMFDIGTTKKLPKSVCQMVFEGLSNTAVQIDINESPATSKDNCGDDNTMTFYFEGGSATTNTGATGEQCGSTVCGTCQKCDASTETCITVSDYEQKCTTDNGKTGWCVSGTCQADSCNCGPNQYCADSNSSCEHPSSSGQCKDLNFEPLDIDGTTYYISDDYISWWDGISACKAMGKNMISHNKMVQTCTSIDDTECSSSDTKLTSLGKVLSQNLNVLSSIILSSTLYNSCGVYGIDATGYLENNYKRNDAGFSVICY